MALPAGQSLAHGAVFGGGRQLCQPWAVAYVVNLTVLLCAPPCGLKQKKLSERMHSMPRLEAPGCQTCAGSTAYSCINVFLTNSRDLRDPARDPLEKRG